MNLDTDTAEAIGLGIVALAGAYFLTRGQSMPEELPEEYAGTGTTDGPTGKAIPDAWADKAILLALRYDSACEESAAFNDAHAAFWQEAEKNAEAAWTKFLGVVRRLCPEAAEVFP